MTRSTDKASRYCNTVTYLQIVTAVTSKTDKLQEGFHSKLQTVT